MPSQDVLTPQEVLFVQVYVQTGNATEAARRAGYKGNDNVLSVEASKRLRKPRIAAAVEDARRDLQALFAAEAYASLQTIKALRDGAEVPAHVRYQAAKDLLDRAGHKPPDQVTLAGKVGVDHGVDPASASALLAALGYDPVGAVEPADAAPSGAGDPAPDPDPGGG